MPNVKESQKTVVALGNFDGVHLGHRKLIETTVRIARERDLIPTVWCFEKHPSFYLHKSVPGVLSMPEEKQKLLEKLGIRRVIPADFLKMGSFSPREFTEKILVDELRAAHVVCGFNYTFGKNAAGDPQMLRELLAPHGVSLTVEPPVDFEGEPVSSTRIRLFLEAGETQKANEMLGAPFALEAPVEHGKHLGQTFGFPTANQSFPPNAAALKQGVYATLFNVEGRDYPAVTNVGVRPTVEHNGSLNCESHLPGFRGDLYGKTARCSFLHFIREERRFDSPQALLAQIHKDVEEVKKYFEKNS